jgi:hypothetical protein
MPRLYHTDRRIHVLVHDQRQHQLLSLPGGRVGEAASFVSQSRQTIKSDAQQNATLAGAV